MAFTDEQEKAIRAAARREAEGVDNLRHLGHRAKIMIRAFMSLSEVRRSGGEPGPLFTEEDKQDVEGAADIMRQELDLIESER